MLEPWSRELTSADNHMHDSARPAHLTLDRVVYMNPVLITPLNPCLVCVPCGSYKRRRTWQFAGVPAGQIAVTSFDSVAPFYKCIDVEVM